MALGRDATRLGAAAGAVDHRTRRRSEDTEKARNAVFTDPTLEEVFEAYMAASEGPAP